MINDEFEYLDEDEYEPELDEALLEDWCAFCDGSAEFDEYHFSTILLGVFVADLTPEVDAFLRRFSKAFPPVLYDNLARIVGPALPDRDPLPWIRRDLEQKIQLLDTDSHTERENIERLVADGNFEFTEDLGALTEIAGASQSFEAICFAESEYVTNRLDGDAKLFALRESLYNIATNYALAHSIMSPIIHGDVDLANYFEIYLRGSDYVVGRDTITVWQYKPV